MNALLTLTAQSLIEHCIGRSGSDVATACDAALSFLRKQGWTDVQLRTLLPAVRRELRTGKRIVSATLVTPAGDAGAAKDAIMSSLERTLSTRVELDERADSTLLGGAVLAVGDDRLDVSLRGALVNLQYHLTRS